MDKIALLEDKREQILKQMREIRAMRKGSVTEQFLKVPRKGKKEPVVKGPYWLYTRKDKGKTIGQRLKAQDAEHFRQEVEAYHRFQVLCTEYAQITERLGNLERSNGLSLQEKKRQKSRSRKMSK